MKKASLIVALVLVVMVGLSFVAAVRKWISPEMGLIIVTLLIILIPLTSLMTPRPDYPGRGGRYDESED